MTTLFWLTLRWQYLFNLPKDLIAFAISAIIEIAELILVIAICKHWVINFYFTKGDFYESKDENKGQNKRNGN